MGEVARVESCREGFAGWGAAMTYLLSEANGRIVHRNGFALSFAQTHSTNFAEGPGYSWNVFWNGEPSRNTNRDKKQPSQKFVEGILDALTSYTHFLLTTIPLTPSV